MSKQNIKIQSPSPLNNRHYKPPFLKKRIGGYLPSSSKPNLPPCWYLPDELPNSKDSGFMSHDTVSASNNSSPSYCEDDDVGFIMSDMDSFDSSLL